MPYLIFYDESDFSLSTKGGSDGEEEKYIEEAVGEVMSNALERSHCS